MSVTVPAADFAERVRAQERERLSPLATPSYPALRARPEPDHELRTPFQRDRDRILHSKAFRRLVHKTQVFVAPEGDHYRTRLTHTLEVTQISRTVARALALNEDLVEAIGLGHDLGHPPFGHIGEAALDACLRERFGSERGFAHNAHSLRVVDEIERLNLCEPVREGILRHSRRLEAPAALEGRIVRLADKIAYLNHDVDDALRAGVIAPGDLPAEAVAFLGHSGSERIDALVRDMVERSQAAGDIAQGEQARAAMAALSKFMFERVYLGPDARREHAKIEGVIRALFDHFCEHPPPETVAGEPLPERVTDWIAGMTDRYCTRCFERMVVPDGFAR